MNQPPDPYALLWQELAPLRHLLQQAEVLLGILAGYALSLRLETRHEQALLHTGPGGARNQR